MNDVAKRELEIWEIGLRILNKGTPIDRVLQWVQINTEMRAANRAKSSIRYNLESINAYFDRCFERSEWKLGNIDMSACKAPPSGEESK